MISWIFPGQPLQREAILPDDDNFYALDLLCQKHCGYDLINNQALDGHKLSLHTCLQVYGVAMSLYRARLLAAKGEKPDLVAEHSLGIYAALSVCGCITEGEALEMVCRIGACMTVMSETHSYALGCPIGVSRNVVEQAAIQAGVFVANYNTSSHFLLAGQKPLIEEALVACRIGGAFSTSSFSCEAPLHTPLMTPLSDELSLIISDYSFREPQIPLIEHYGQTRLGAALIPSFLLSELLQPVNWEQTWKCLRDIGISRCIEVGSGQSLSKFNRWIDAEESR